MVKYAPVVAIIIGKRKAGDTRVNSRQKIRAVIGILRDIAKNAVAPMRAADSRGILGKPI